MPNAAQVRNSMRSGSFGRGWVRARGVGSVLTLLLAMLLVGGCLASTPSASVGAVFGRDPDSGALHVREVPAGLAADEAGLLPGDRVKMIDGLYVDELDAERIHTLLRGSAGSDVTLTIVRDGEVQHLEVTRRQLGKPPPVEDGEQRIE